MFDALQSPVAIQVHVSAIENPAEASFFESFEAAHTTFSLSGSIATVLPPSSPTKLKNVLKIYTHTALSRV